MERKRKTYHKNCLFSIIKLIKKETEYEEELIIQK